MKKHSIIFAGIFFSICAHASTIEVTVTGFRSGDGHVGMSLFNKSKEKSFPKDSTAAEQSFYLPLNGQKSFILEISDVAETKYAISLMHDENSNGKLDTNAVGMPKEGFGFSNNPKVTFGAPNFKKCEFSVGPETKQIEIKAQYLL